MAEDCPRGTRASIFALYWGLAGAPACMRNEAGPATKLARHFVFLRTQEAGGRREARKWGL